VAHLRNRLIAPIFNKVLTYSPIVGVLGHRQVGKTTFLESEIENYVTFDDLKTLRLAKTDAQKFLNKYHNKTVAIDECQFVETLFPALKEAVRKNKKPGQFIW
jgi:predicted AAA+ superfamily ATPase